MMRKRLMLFSTFVIVSSLVLVFAWNVMAQTDPLAQTGLIAGMNMTTPTPATTDLNSNLDLQISGNSTASNQPMMDDMMQMANMAQQQQTVMNNMMNMGSAMMNQMMSMETPMMNQMMSMGMGGMNNSSMSGSGGLDPNILAQIQATNTMLTQMLTLLLSQNKDADTQVQLQTIQQMLINQASLVQTLSNGSMTMGPVGMSPTMPGNNGSMNMGSSSSGMSGMMM
ncbi:MAG TPA: hypothetical protein VHY08_12985 [Bacillota bacterium]|nr:hypothetical protein [Bacillota bacterium]